MEAILQSVITCPHCGAVTEETMPLDACQFFYECTACHTVLCPKSGDCCLPHAYELRKMLINDIDTCKINVSPEVV